MASSKLKMIFAAIFLWVSSALANSDLNEKDLKSDLSRLSEQVKTLDEKIEKNTNGLRLLEQELKTKTDANSSLKDLQERAEKALDNIGDSESELQKSLNHNMAGLEDTKNQLEALKKKQSQLQENVKTLQDDIEIDRDNLGKLLKSKTVWEKNLKAYRMQLVESTDLKKDLEAQFKSEKSMLEKNEQERSKWKEQLEKKKLELEKLKSISTSPSLPIDVSKRR